MSQDASDCRVYMDEPKRRRCAGAAALSASS
jgi:hypothetical protein